MGIIHPFVENWERQNFYKPNEKCALDQLIWDILTIDRIDMKVFWSRITENNFFANNSEYQFWDGYVYKYLIGKMILDYKLV